MTNSSALMGASATYQEALYRQYRTDPSSVDESWRLVFQVLDDLEVADRQGTAPRRESSDAEFIRDRGHLVADLDPLHPAPPRPAGADDDREAAPLRRLYEGALTLETAHIDDAFIREDCRRRFETRSDRPDPSSRRRALGLLWQAEEFERAIGLRYPTKKRFGAEGAEAIVPLLDRVLSAAAREGINHVVIGTMHRGRLSLTANVIGKPLAQLFEEVVGAHPLRDSSQPADVPYHLGYEGELAIDGRSLRVSMLPNPSHLEAINPVALGRARALQDQAPVPENVLCVLLHTDASVIGQGSVAETLQLSDVAGYSVRGTIHLIINNQIGFTTNPDEARSSRYCTGIWKALDSPILHVNGDSIDDVLEAGELAVAFRNAHKRDVAVDLVCYRRNGHNEIDEPRFTQPVEYDGIARHETVARIYARTLADEGLLADDAERAARSGHADRFGAALTHAKERVLANDTVSVPRSPSPVLDPQTGIDLDTARETIAALAAVPAAFQLEKKFAQIVERRGDAERTGLQWALGEALAIGSLVREGVPVRLTGQDVIRGAFSHRHFALVDSETGERRFSLNHLSHNQAVFDVVNSPLSEYAVLGFEYGYSVERTDALTIWEAQFGDFANGAQIVIDQFIASGEAKWGQNSGLVMLLPHGLEGQGPEHSSARAERFLQLAADHNFELVHPSTPANYFHLLRRQVKCERRVPLVVLSPKKLLRLPAAMSPLADFGPGSSFRPVIATHGEHVDTVLICSGKIAYELEAERAAREHWSTAIVRLERLYPLADDALLALFRQWEHASFAWVQEEPGNYGAWGYLDRRLESILVRAGARDPRVTCIARNAQSSPAGSFHGRHDADQKHLMDQAFNLRRVEQPVRSIRRAAVQGNLA